MDRGPLLIIAFAVFAIVVVVTLLQRLRKPRQAVSEAYGPKPIDEDSANPTLRDKFISSFERTKVQSKLAGSKRYRWITTGDGTVCEYCKSKSGKLFSWDYKHEHPGYHKCSDVEICRCYAEPIIPD
ncbi:hypothetical protein ACOKS3_17345 [Pseudomonas sp. HS6-2]|uniref:hypothetical protein n=1 Tax=Pseudomonas sp. HS6-2 TaxID=3410986 RepID=UPI003BDE0270